MSANASAVLTITARTRGVEDVRALATELARVGRVGRSTAAAGVSRASGAVGAVGGAAGAARGKLRSVEQEIERLQRKGDQKRITAQARAMLEGPPGGTPPIVGKLRSVDGEIRRLTLLRHNREVTARARSAIGDDPSILTGHGFTNRSRQALGLMRDMTVAGAGVRFAMQSAASVVGGMVNPMLEFEQTLAQTQIKGEFTADQMKDIAKAAREVGRTSEGGFGAREAAAASVELAASGLSAPDVAAQLPTVLKFALAGDVATDMAASTLVETSAQFGLAASDFAKIGNTLQRGADVSTIAVGDIAESLSYVGPVAKSAGLELGRVVGMVSLLGNRGVKASSAGTALRKMLTSLVDPSGPAEEALNAIGISADQARAGLSDLPGLLQKMSAGLAGASRGKRLQVLSRIFGERGITSAEILMKAVTEQTKEGISVFEDFENKVSNAGTAMDDAAKIAGGTTAGNIRKMNAAFEDARIQLGTHLVPLITELTPKLTAMTIATGDFIGRNEGLVQTLAIAIPALGATTVAANGLGAAFGGVAKLAGVFGVQLGMGAGAAFGTSFIGAAIPLIAAGLAGAALGTAIDKAMGGAGAKAGATVYELIHGEGAIQRTERGKAGFDAPEMAIKARTRAARADLAREMQDPILQNIRRQQYGIDDPLTSALVQQGEGAGKLARMGWTGKLEIAIAEDRSVRVANVETSGPDLEVGTNVKGE